MISVYSIKKLPLVPSLLAFALLIVASSCWCFDTEITQFNSASEIDFSPNNIHFLSVDKTLGVVNIWRVDTKSLIYVYTPPSFPNTAKYSKDGNYIGIGMQNGNVLILVAATMATYNSINPSGSGAIIEIDFSWNSNNFVSCNGAKVEFLALNGTSYWSLNKVKLKSCKMNKVDGVGYSFNDKQLEWYSSGGTTKVASASATGNFFYQVDFSTDNKTTRLIAVNDDNILYDIRVGDSGSPNNVFTLDNDGYAACYSKDNKYMAVGDLSGKFYVFNATNTADVLFSKFSETTVALWHCRFSYDNKYLAVSSNSGSIYFYTTNCFSNICGQGSYDDNGVCKSCSSIPGCLTCESATICKYCAPGFYLNGLICSSCLLSKCRSCQSNSKCLECEQGYFLNYSSNTCSECITNITGCISCQRNSTNTTLSCRQCSPEYYLNSTDSLCYPCVSNNSRCLRCNSSSNCLQCQMGYYSDTNFVCQTCSSNCLFCTSNVSCIVCAKGYYSNSTNQCTSCSSNCLDCYNTGACISCIKGTYLNAGACSLCVFPCSTCNTSSTYCYSCSLGYYYAGSGSCLSCQNISCLTCNSSSLCTSCQVGYYLNPSNLCSICSNAYSNCSTCNSTACFSCQSGFYLNSTSSCQSCSSISNCYLCQISTTCLQCLIGFYLSTGSCLSCPTQCESCTNSTFCVNCAVGYYFSSNTCTVCTSPCITCNSSSNCLSCQNGYFLDAATSPNTCTKCILSIVGCVSCNSSSFCNECQVGRYVSSAGACSVCPSNCSTCNASSQCLSCNVGYYLSGSVCVKCHQNCSQCSSAVCSSCNLGFYLNTSVSTNNCLPCSSIGCQTCTINGCLSCQVGFYLSSTSCLSCNNTYPNCLTCSESGCVRCLYGFYSNSGVCTLCYNTLDGCVSCYNNTVCSQCGPSYYLAGNSTCALCQAQCKTCKNNVCTSCQPRYIFNAAQTDCLLCESYVKGCQICTANNTCTSCYEGYYLSSPSTCANCKANLLGCISCSNSSFCTVCQDEYYLVGGVCTTCYSIQFCLYCTNSTACLQCMSGYYLNTNKTCSLCTVSLPGCVFCTSPSACKQCQTGYFLNSTSNQCQLCANTLGGCLSCLNSSKCISCDGGYYLSAANFVCLSCNVTGCQVCGDNTPSVCLSCSLGYYLSGTTCLDCPQSGCLQCTNSSYCSKCDAGYYLLSNSCTKCQTTLTACSQCINSTICTQCDTTYFLNSTALQCQSCQVSLPYCQICFNSSYCSVCKSSYYSQSGSCLSCSLMPGCFMCLSSTLCQTCFKGYFLSANQCVQCSNAIANCYDCSNSSTCLSCQSGFLLDASNNCSAVSVSGGVEPQPIPYLEVKTYYVNGQTLKHVFSAKQGYTFTKQTLSWSTVTTISLYNSASSSSITLTISSAEWGKNQASIIFYTNNPLNINSDIFTMSFTRLLVTQNDFSLSYQTKFKMTQAALALLLPNNIIPNDYSQQQPLMEPSFFMSYIKNTGQYYFTIIGYVIVGALFINFFLKSTCTAPASKNMGSIVPHVLALKTCVLMVYPIYPQIANFCFGLMAADLPWFAEYYASYLSYSVDSQPAGFQLFYNNMNFASMYLSAFLLLLLFILIGCLSLGKIRKQEDDVFSLSQTKSTNKNEVTYSYLRMVYLFFSFGLTFAGAASIQGSLLNPNAEFTINGLFYMLGGIIYCIQLGLTIKLTKKEQNSCYARSFIKASVLSVAHISPVYICTLAFIIDQIIVALQFYEKREKLQFPKIWIFKNTLANLCLLFLYYFNEKKIVLLLIIASIFLIIIIQLIEHISETGEDVISKKINPVEKNKHKIDQITIEEKQYTLSYLKEDGKLQSEDILNISDENFNESKTTFKSSTAFSGLGNSNTFQIISGRSTQKRYRPFKKAALKKQRANMNLIIERDQDIFED